MSRAGAAALALAAVLAGAQAPPAPADLDTKRIAAADDEPGSWLTHGRTYGEQRFSPLAKINTDTVGTLGLAWSYELRPTAAHEATPLVVDGVMYVTSAWSLVHALDAATGSEAWVYDPKVDRAVGAKACCDVVNRGVALYGGKVFVGVIDGRLVALDAKTGSVAWETVTVDQSQPYTITGAPRAANGLVYIGNGGAEYGVRGYVSAYDAQTGTLAWRFYTVPGDPAKGPRQRRVRPDHGEGRRDVDTASGGRCGGGGTVWDAIVYDPDFNQLIIGVGNGSPWNQQIRSPGGGDNLFLASIVALDAATGAYKWHYQTTPGETWDYTATQPIMLADLTIDGKPRKVAMQAPKNGFFYVVDRDERPADLAPAPFSTCRRRRTRRRACPSAGPTPSTRRRAGRSRTPRRATAAACRWCARARSARTTGTRCRSARRPGLVYLPAQDMPSTTRHDPASCGAGVQQHRA